MKKHRAKLVVYLLLVSFFVSACSSFSKTDVTTHNERVALNFSWWGNDIRHIYTLDAISIFEEQNEEIDVKSHYGVWNGYEQRNRVYMRSDDESDVMQINYAWLNTYSPDGLGYYDLNRLRDYIDFSNFSEEDLQFGMVEGKLNALPIAFNTPVIYYTKELYDQYDLDLPNTWEDLFQAARVMREDGVYPLGAAKKHVFLLMIAYYEQTTGKPFFSEEQKLNITQEELEENLRFYKKLFEEKVLMPIEQWNLNKMSDGSCAGDVMWVSDADNYCAAYEEGGYTPVLGSFLGVNDENAKLPGWYMKPATMYAISDTTEHPEAAAKLLNFLLNSPDMAKLQQTEKGVPISRNAYQTLEKEGLLQGRSYEANELMLRQREDINTFLPIMENSDLIECFKENSDSYLYDKVSVEEAAANMYKEMQEICNKRNVR